MAEQLTNDAIAAEYLARGGGVANAGALVRWLNGRGIGHRDAAAIAREVNALQTSKTQPVESPEVIAFRDDVAQGTTARSQAQLAAQINAMSVEEFAQYRQTIGLGQ